MEKIWSPHLNLPDFSQATYTAIVSDLHLCEAEPVNLKYPLWKKYKTREFFFDEPFEKFLKSIQDMSHGEPIELILNGDTFDFDSVCQQPEHPTFKVSWIEKSRGLAPQREKSLYKIRKILEDHQRWTEAMRDFISRGHRVVFVIGNHDLELIWPDVQDVIIQAFAPHEKFQSQVRFCEFFYVSNRDTLVEHGHQYDPYCRAEDMLHPFILRYNRLELKLPFGNLATRYMINAMGFFNPYVEANYIMSLREYVKFFFKYIVRAQPLLILTWLWGATLTLITALRNQVKSTFKNPMVGEERIDDVGRRANAQPRVVRELKELAVPSAAGSPIKIARELWLDRAFIVLVSLFICFEAVLFVKQLFAFSIFWIFIPILLVVPFFIFYSKSIESRAQSYKEPQERILVTAGFVTGTSRVIYGHTHVVRHEIIGTIEHLNSGTWSPAFKDVECSQMYDQKTFIWISPNPIENNRQAEVYQMLAEAPQLFFHNRK